MTKRTLQQMSDGTSSVSDPPSQSMAFNKALVGIDMSNSQFINKNEVYTMQRLTYRSQTGEYDIPDADAAPGRVTGQVPYVYKRSGLAIGIIPEAAISGTQSASAAVKRPKAFCVADYDYKRRSLMPATLPANSHYALVIGTTTEHGGKTSRQAPRVTYHAVVIERKTKSILGLWVDMDSVHFFPQYRDDYATSGVKFSEQIAHKIRAAWALESGMAQTPMDQSGSSSGKVSMSFASIANPFLDFKNEAFRKLKEIQRTRHRDKLIDFNTSVSSVTEGPAGSFASSHLRAVLSGDADPVDATFLSRALQQWKTLTADLCGTKHDLKLTPHELKFIASATKFHRYSVSPLVSRQFVVHFVLRLRRLPDLSDPASPAVCTAMQEVNDACLMASDVSAAIYGPQLSSLGRLRDVEAAHRQTLHADLTAVTAGLSAHTAAMSKQYLSGAVPTTVQEGWSLVAQAESPEALHQAVTGMQSVAVADIFSYTTLVQQALQLIVSRNREFDQHAVNFARSERQGQGDVLAAEVGPDAMEMCVE